jgi:hypothetical protein
MSAGPAQAVAAERALFRIRVTFGWLIPKAAYRPARKIALNRLALPCPEA